jgi:mediator of RNA polymerase II transcription subunit 6
MSDPLDEIQWKSPEFIQERGLHTGNVLEYFSLSPFYDRTSNNQVLMMQFQFQQIQIPAGTSFHQYFQSRLAEMVGIEFVIASNREPDFWVIRKQKRLDTKNTSNSVTPLQDYYVIGANIYQAPKIYDILSSRLLASVLAIKNLMDLLNNMTKFHVSDGGHTYNISSYNIQQAEQQRQLRLQSRLSSQQLSSKMGSSSNTIVNTVTPMPIQTPHTVSNTDGNTGALTLSNIHNLSNPAIEITSGAFDNLLNNVVQSSNHNNSSKSTTNDTETLSIYLDDIPLYGKGSTVEMLGLKINLDDLE